ncbi:MAG: metallo-mystery pair system four-Cys motif protein [Anaerolineae bacterium]|nr:metallo-mystery pair system four-Cys motif protein [Anaerolineae bacterium]
MKNPLQIATAFVLVASLTLTANRTTSAHAMLVSAEPAPNSIITESPKQIKLVFSEALQAVGHTITLLDEKKNKVEVGKAMLDPADGSKKTLIAEIPTMLPMGSYTVEWKNLATDGHSERGQFTFTLAEMAEMTLKFAFKAGKEPVACGKEIKNLGARRTTAQIMDARFYVSNIRLISAGGAEVPFALQPDGKWQTDRVALLDFEDGSGMCKETGTPDMRDVVIGKAPAGQYTGIVFDLGIPFELNHADVAVEKAPLNVQALWWNWQTGYKFVRIDLATNVAPPNDKWFIHLGSTGCGKMMNGHGGDPHGMANKPPEKPCANPNLVTIRLNRFDPARDQIVADLAGLLTNVDIAQSTPKPAGCMSGVDDPDCRRLIPNFGLSLANGQCVNGCRGQRFFRVEAAPKS